MELHCPDCGLPIPAVEVAPSAGLAVCRLCDQTYPLAACQQARPLEERADLPLGPPPKGVVVTEGVDGFRLEASTRSCMAFFLVPFTLLWAGGSLGGIYGTQFYKGEFNLWMSLFGIPFLLGSAFLIGLTAMTVAGRQVIELKHGRLHVHAGAFGLRWGRSVDWRDVESVRLNEKTGRGYRAVHEVEILVRGDKPLSLGSGIEADRLRWTLRFLAGRIRLGR
jgi:hypothetical protein